LGEGISVHVSSKSVDVSAGNEVSGRTDVRPLGGRLKGGHGELGSGWFRRKTHATLGCKSVSFAMNKQEKIAAHIAYDDLRQWLKAAERLGEVKTVTGASWQEDIGLAAEAILRAEKRTRASCSTKCRVSSAASVCC
jgi:hypothetical protein